MLAVFLDTETTGLNPLKHHIIEIAYKIVDVETGELKAAFSTLISLTKQQWANSDPESLKIHQFKWEEVSKGASLELVKELILQAFDHWKIRRGQALFICQNPSFDRAFFSQIIDPNLAESLNQPYHWLDLASMYWAIAVRKGKHNEAPFPWKTGVSKDSIAKAYNLPMEEKPHRAMNGVDHLLLCYKALVGFPY